MRFLSGVAVALVIGACGGHVSAGATDASTDGVPPDTTPPSNVTRTFALRQIFLGDTTRDGTPRSDAWKAYGLDLDGKTTAASSTGVCARAPGAPSNYQVDGIGGIDNAFGAVIVPLLQSAASLSGLSSAVTDLYQSGTLTLQVSTKGLTESLLQTSVGLTGGLFPSRGYQTSPSDPQFPGFGAATDWPVPIESVTDGASLASGPKVAFGNAGITHGTFVGSGLDLPLRLAFGTFELSLVVHHATLLFARAAKGAASDGTIAGVLDTEEVVAAFKKEGGRIAKSLCGAQFDGLALQIRQAADIMRDLTNVSGTSCNGISIGVGFEAMEIANPTRVTNIPDPVAPDPCF